MTNPDAMPGYDNWKLASPEDDKAIRKEQPPEVLPRQPHSHVVHGRRYYEEDFIYDPMRGK